MARGDVEDEAWFTYALSPVRDESGAVIAFLNVVSETTARIRAEQATNEARAAAERAESRMREVFAQAPVAVCVLDGPAHVYGLVNPRYQRLVPGRALVGRPIRDALPELAGQGVFELLDAVYTTGRPHVASEYPLLVDRDGDGTMHEAVFNFVYQPVRDAAGAVSAIAVVATDVTELVQARRGADALRAQAEEANAAKSQFLAMMSHELRTPLNAIGGYAQLLELGVHGPILPAQADALARIQSSQQHLLGLINAVLNYARLEAGRVQYDLEPVLLADALREVEALMAGQAHAKGLTLTAVDVAACAGLTAVADREKLRQVLLNLLSNAVKFTDAGGRVSMDCAADDGTVRVAVRDTGRGIPEDQLLRVFEPFVQVGRNFATPDAGTGLGLAISRDLARGMGGDLTVESRVGVGSTFTVTLPAAAATS
jgi:signal transduction histidine kinase